MINPEIQTYNTRQKPEDQLICDVMAKQISSSLPEAENKIWHAHPVWFLNGNPIVGYSKQKHFIRLMFWSGQSFCEDKLNLKGKKFKDASIAYKAFTELNKD